MIKIWNRFRTGLVVLTLAAAALCMPGHAFAGDKVTLKDGKVVEGTIVREVDGYIWVKYQIGGLDREQMFRPDEIDKIERESATPAATPGTDSKGDATDPSKTTTPPAAGNGVPKAAVITLGSRDSDQGDEVGVYMTAYELKEMLPMLEDELGKDGTGVVVFRVTSGGGYLSEIQRISDEIQNEYKKHFRTVAWIDSAISAAAMSSLCIEEIYMTPQGNFGACTGWSGQLVAVKGRALEEVLEEMRKISARGGYNPMIMRSMQIQVPLSATIDPNGEVHYYNDATSGDILVNREGEILTFNAQTAARVKFSKGTAATIQDLQKLMGYQELEWVGKAEKNIIWPVCKAEKWNNDYRRKVHNDEERFNEYVRSYNLQIAAATGEQNRQERGKFVNQARQSLDKIKAACRTNPNFGPQHLGTMTERDLKDFFEQQEKRLRDLMR